jgi:sugar-specific transcriptional regulator TrmB
MEAAITLVELGLTHNQARIYLALLRSERLLTAKEISKITRITRQDVYRILPELQNSGVVEKTITSPAMFRATPIKTAITTLVSKKTAQDNCLIEKAHKLSREFEKELPLSPEQEPEFILIPGNQAVLQKINTLSGSAQKSIDIITSRKRFPRALFEFFDARKQSLQRGVKIRTVSESITSTNPDMDKLIAIEAQAGVEVKFLAKPLSALLTIFDDKEVMIITSASGTLETSALWSNNPSLITVAKSYFDSLWQVATETPKL